MTVSFTYTLLHNHLIRLADKLAGETPPRGDVPKMEISALGAIVLAATAVEAGVNHVVEVWFRPTAVTEKSAPVLYLARKHVDKLRPPMKRLEAVAFAAGLPFDPRQEPWSSAGELGRLRNALIHYESHPVRSSVDGTAFPNDLQPLARRLNLWTVLEKEGTWLDVFLNQDCAVWATHTAHAALRALDSGPWINR